MRPNEQDNQLIWETLKEAGDWPKMGPRDAGDDHEPEMDSAEDYQQYLQGKEEAGRVPPGQGLDRDDSNWENSDALADMLHRELTDLWRDEIEGTDMGDLPPDQLRQEKESLKAYINKFIDEQLPDSPKEQRPR